ncbi:MAG: XrtA system polysaccharide deacetylase [Bacteroidota bacterium]
MLSSKGGLDNVTFLPSRVLESTCEVGKPDAIINAMTIDLEDWFCVHNLSQVIKKEEWDRYEMRVLGSTRRILALLKKHEVNATFFVLGWIAERAPELIREIESDGHEIATHGYSHSLLTEMTPEEFEKDLEKALKVTRLCTEQSIIGFRAPSFSITKETMWAFDILKEYGLLYDSSIFPVRFHPNYGIPDAPLHIHSVGSLIEVPLSSARFARMRIPCSGGGYFRFFPYPFTKYLMQQCIRESRPVIFYIHPWEFDTEQPRMHPPWLKRFRHYYNLHKTWERFDRLLSDFRFTSIRKLLGL